MVRCGRTVHHAPTKEFLLDTGATQAAKKTIKDNDLTEQSCHIEKLAWMKANIKNVVNHPSTAFCQQRCERRSRSQLCRRITQEESEKYTNCSLINHRIKSGPIGESNNPLYSVEALNSTRLRWTLPLIAVQVYYFE